MAEEKKESDIEELAKQIYNAETLEDCKKCSELLNSIEISDYLYRCLNDYLTFRRTEARKCKTTS